MGEVFGDVESLRNRILQQAREEAARTLNRAQRVAERDLVYAREEAEEIRAEQRSKMQPILEAERRKSVVSAEMESRRRLLEKKDELVSRIFAEAEAHLMELRGSDIYTSIIFSSIENSVASIDEDAIVEFGERDKDIFTPDTMSSIKSRVAERSGENIRLEFQCVGDDILAGVIIRSKDGRIVIDDSFSGLIGRLKEELRGKVSEMLLEE